MSLQLLSIIDQLRGTWHPNCPTVPAVLEAVCHGHGLRVAEMYAERDAPARAARKACIIAPSELRPVMSQPEISVAVGLSRNSHGYVNQVLQAHRADALMHASPSAPTSQPTRLCVNRPAGDAPAGRKG